MIIKNHRYQGHGSFITIQPQQKKDDIRIIFDNSYCTVQKYSEFIAPAWYKLTKRPRTILEILNSSIRK